MANIDIKKYLDRGLLPITPTGSERIFDPTTFRKDSLNELSQNNPYATMNYRKSWWQKVLTGLGFRTNYDAYKESLQLQAQEYDNQLQQKAYQEQYDSPLAQAQREAAAGLNPDLVGNISPGETPGMVDDGNPPIAPEADDAQMLFSFGSSVLQAVQMAFGFAGDIQALKGAKMDNATKFNSMVRDAWKLIMPDIYEARNSSDGSVNVSNFYRSLSPYYKSSMSKKQFNTFVERVNHFANSAEGWQIYYDMQDKKAKSRKSMFQEFAGQSYSEWDDIMSSIGDELGNLAYNLTKKKSENELAYQEGFDPKTRAHLDSAPEDLQLLENDVRLSNNQVDLSDYQKSLRSSFHSILKSLDAAADRGNKVAPIVKAVLSVILMGNLPMPSFGRLKGLSQ